MPASQVNVVSEQGWRFLVDSVIGHLRIIGKIKFYYLAQINMGNVPSGKIYFLESASHLEIDFDSPQVWLALEFPLILCGGKLTMHQSWWSPWRKTEKALFFGAGPLCFLYSPVFYQWAYLKDLITGDQIPFRSLD